MEFNNYIDALKATKKQHEEEAERLGKMIAEEEAKQNPAKAEEPVIEETEKKFAYEFTDDEKKVMKGLECCGTEDDGDICEKCPYADASTECSDKNREALELIKKLAGLYEVVVSDLNDLANKYVKIREEADAIHADRDAALKKIAEQKAEIERLKNAYREGLEQGKFDSQVKIEELQNQVDGLSIDLENWKKAAYGYKYAEEQAVKYTAIAKEANESIKENAANLMKEVEELNNKVRAKDFEITCLKLRLAARNFGVSAATAGDKLRIANLTKERDEWKEKYEAINADRDEALIHIKHLKEDIEALKKKNWELANSRVEVHKIGLPMKHYAKYQNGYNDGYDKGRKGIVKELVKYVDSIDVGSPCCFINKKLFKQFCNLCLEG